MISPLPLLALFANFATSTMSSNTTIKTIEPFNLSAQPGTDIWRKPPSTNVFNAAFYPNTQPTYPLKQFQRAKITFALPPSDELRRYDQAGLVLHLTKEGVVNNATKWIKTGIEFYTGKPFVATVGCDIWADWSLVPMPEFVNGTEPTATIEARMEQDELGKSLWIYWIVRNEQGEEVERRPLREVNWFAAAAEDGWDVSIAGYVARPTTAGGDGLLEAEFKEGLEIEVSK